MDNKKGKEDKGKNSIFSKENNSALHGELGRKNRNGCLILLGGFFIIYVLGLIIG
tara:strand:- start:1230 stop:1394 length:165 start_codon:yes stop_codon:yes gene_type:complete